MDKKAEREYSKLLSFILRHEPDFVGVTPDEAGWVSIEALLMGLEKREKPLSRQELEQIVRDSDKKRFSLSEDGERIRSNQGHSIEVALGYEAAEPPGVLYHGTASRFIKAIADEGLTKRSRHHVHLSTSIDTASKVGVRHGKLVLLEIQSARMHQDGFEFFLSANGVWLTDHVPVRYIVFPDRP